MYTSDEIRAIGALYPVVAFYRVQRDGLGGRAAIHDAMGVCTREAKPESRETGSGASRGRGLLV
jgi:hypothetical protein